MDDGRYVTKRLFDVYEGVTKNQGGVAGVIVTRGGGLGETMVLRGR